MRSRPLLLAAVAAVLAGGVVAVLLLGGDGEANEDTTATPADTSGEAPPRQAGSGPPGAGAGARASARAGLRRVGRFDSPLYVTAPPGDRRRVFVVEQGGTIRLLLNGRKLRRPFLDIAGLITSGGEQGLLSMAFAPDYERSGRFYVNFTDRNGNTRVQELRRSRRNPNRANVATRRPVLFVRQPFSNHNGGLVLFGPDDLLYIGMGDGGSGGDPFNNAQKLGSLLGKLLRIDPRGSGGRAYSVPRSNPFVGRPGRDEIYAYGLRNPWRFSFDRNGDLYLGDVGQDSREEIDYQPSGRARGRNFGWSCFEGDRRYDSDRSCPSAAGPVLDYGRGNGECSVTGGLVARDPALPGMGGRYLYGDFCRGQVRSFRISGGRATDDRAVGPRVPQLSSFGTDDRGRVYVTSLNGPVYRLVAR